jgi:VWFA-related protein
MRRISALPLWLLAALVFCLAVLPAALNSAPAQQQNPPAQKPGEEYKIRQDVNLVVLHATVLDDRGRFVPDLKQENFRIYEDKVEQKMALFKREDVPITVGLVVDNSGSMREKRERVNAAALAFVEASNPNDEAFVVNFNDDYYLDMDKDFTNDINVLKEALERIDSRGSTALYDAVVGSLDHLKKGSRDKRVLLVVTDGEDNASRVGHGDRRKGLELTVLEAQKSDAVIYAVGLLGKDSGRSARNAREALTRLSMATGGLAFFPEALHDVTSICTQIAHDIRNQYTLAYYPSNTRRDGSYRSVNVEVIPPRGKGKLSIRTRTGYYAQKEAGGDR